MKSSILFLKLPSITVWSANKYFAQPMKIFSKIRENLIILLMRQQQLGCTHSTLCCSVFLTIFQQYEEWHANVSQSQQWIFNVCYKVNVEQVCIFISLHMDFWALNMCKCIYMCINAISQQRMHYGTKCNQVPQAFKCFRSECIPNRMECHHKIKNTNTFHSKRLNFKYTSKSWDGQHNPFFRVGRLSCCCCCSSSAELSSTD